METIIVQIERIAYRKEDSKWTIAVTDKGSIKGVIPFDVKEGDWVKLEGKWQHSDFNGKQEFNFRGAMLHLPEDPRALLRYAVSITKGLGEAKEESIWQKYGAKWREQEELNLPSITKATGFHWQDTLRRLREQAVQTQAMAFLLEHGCTLNLATTAWAQWKNDTLGKVNADPYALCDLPHYGFAWIDENVRPSFGIKVDDPRRIDAAIMYCMGTLAEKQGTALPGGEVCAAVQALIASNGNFDARVGGLIEAGKVVRLGEDHIALQRDWENENAIWERWKA